MDGFFRQKESFATSALHSAMEGSDDQDAASDQEATSEVEILTLNGAVESFRVKSTDTILCLKRAIGLRRQAATARLRLLAGTSVLCNDCLLAQAADLAPAGRGGAMRLQLLQELRPSRPPTVRVLAAAAPEGDWEAAVEVLLAMLVEAGVQQGQVMWIDLHNRGPGTESSISAYYRPELPGRGRLDIGHAIFSGSTWEELYQTASLHASGKDVISISGTSSSSGPLLGLFYCHGETVPAASIEFASCAAPSWNYSMFGLLGQLYDLQVQKGQLISIDAHDDQPGGQARFTAHFSKALPGYGDLFLAFDSMESTGPWQDFYSYGCKAAADTDVVAITSSSSDDGRGVLYSVSYAEPLGFVEATAFAGDWEAATAELAAQLRERGVGRGQLLHVDAHNEGLDRPAVLCAYYDRSTPSTGPLELLVQVQRGQNWELLYKWADQAMAGKSVVSVTGASCGPLGCADRLAVLLLSEPGAPALGPDARVEHICTLGGSWQAAARRFLDRLAALGLERGQLLSIDAHNVSPEAPAMFSAHFCREPAGRGPLDLSYQSLALQGSWPSLHRHSAVLAAGKDVVSITSSSNENSKHVSYIFLNKAESGPVNAAM